MEMLLTRKISTNESTIGELQVDGKFECFTLEDKVREVKIAKVTAIPAGRYEVDVTFSNRFKQLMPLLLKVPNFEGIRIHTGNTAAHTEGCILVGQAKEVDKITGSKLAYAALFAKIQQAKKRNEKIWIDIKNDLDKLVFDGKWLTWFRGSDVHKRWPAVSGREGYQHKSLQGLKDKGPIPEGEWEVRILDYQKMPPRGWFEQVLAELGRTAWPGGESSWGQHRVWLRPCPGTSTYGRSGFSIHGGDSPGSAGCIDLTHKMPEFALEFVTFGKDLKLTVKYL